MSNERELISKDIEGYLRRYQDKELLRFVTVGSVDDGKSTLIGRLLYDTGSVYSDQLDAVRAATHASGLELDLSLLTDGLAAEREQGITIDVAYRYFSTERRKYIIADTPGHVQYTRNMVTGASTAQVALILIDARLGVLQQSRRHAFIASLLGITHLAVCVNKMDLVSYDRDVFSKIQTEFSAFTRSLSFSSVTFFPISAISGANCVHPSSATPWYAGPTVLGFLESVPVQVERTMDSLRYPIQYVTRPNLDYRGYAGRVASGIVRKGDAVCILPSGRASRIRAIDTFDGELQEAFAPQSVTLRLEDEVDVSRGDMVVHPSSLPFVTRTVDAHLVWLHETPLDLTKTYFLKHTTQVVRAAVDQVHWRKDMDTLEEVAAATLGLNDIGRVTLTAHRPLFVDNYSANRETGSFIFVDPITNATVAAGMITDAGSNRTGSSEQPYSDAARPPSTAVSTGTDRDAAGVIFVGNTSNLDGLSRALEQKLSANGVASVSLRAASLNASLDAARAVGEAGLLAIVLVESPGLDDAGIAALARAERLLVVHAGLSASSEPRSYDGTGLGDASFSIDMSGAETALTSLAKRLMAGRRS